MVTFPTAAWTDWRLVVLWSIINEWSLMMTMNKDDNDRENIFHRIAVVRGPFSSYYIIATIVVYVR